MALRARPHSIGHREFLRIQDSQVARFLSEGGKVRLPRAMTAFTGNAYIDMCSTRARLPVACEALPLELRAENPAERSFVGDGLLFRKSRRTLQSVRRGIVQVAAFDQRRAT